MRAPSDEVAVTYADFIKLCRVEDPDDWIPGLRVAFDGVWVKGSDNGPLSGKGAESGTLPGKGAGFDLLSVEEQAALTEHPDGDPSKPVLTFPCTLGAIRKRIVDFYGAGFIDPFDLADFVLAGATLGVSTVSKASEAQLERRGRERSELLQVALAVLWHFPPDKKTAAALARRIDEKAGLFWRETGVPPVNLRTLTKKVACAIALPEK